jgi:hypothetical protein
VARREEEREDLLREATALVERAEFRTGDGEPIDSEPIVGGFRRDGSVSLFFGADPVYQFTAANELRRAYRHGFLIKAERGNLVRLERHRTESAVELLRHEMSAEESKSFLTELVDRLNSLREEICSGNYQLIGRVPEECDVMTRIMSWLRTLQLPPAIATSPRLRAKS